MKKRIIASKFWIIFGAFGCALFLSTAVAAAWRAVADLLRGDDRELWFAALAVPFFVILAVIDFILMNRFACVVTHDYRRIERRGLLFGFRYGVDLNDVTKVVVFTMPRAGRYIMLIDKNRRSTDPASRDSYIRFEYNEKNFAFIREIWPGRIQFRDEEAKGSK